MIERLADAQVVEQGVIHVEDEHAADAVAQVSGDREARLVLENEQVGGGYVGQVDLAGVVRRNDLSVE